MRNHPGAISSCVEDGQSGNKWLFWCSGVAVLNYEHWSKYDTGYRDYGYYLSTELNWNEKR